MRIFFIDNAIRLNLGRLSQKSLIRRDLGDKTMANKLMPIPNDTQNFPFCGLQLVIKSFKSLNLKNRRIKNL